MTVQRVATITCDRCKRTDELKPTKNAGRAVKPVGWARLSMNAKMSTDAPVEVVKVADLCPDCRRRLTRFIDDGETVPA